MAIGDIINKADFNNIQSLAEDILGVGSSNYGYGQVVQSSQVDENNKVTVQEWTLLRYDLTNIAIHQNGTAPSLPSATEGAKIKFDNTTEPYDRFQIFLSSLNTNRFQVASNQFVTTNHGAAADFTSTWKNALECIVTVEFPSGEAARNFFNAGGKIRFFSTRSGGTTSGGGNTIAAQNANWTALLDGASPAAFTGGSSLTLNGNNYFGCTSSYTSPFFSATGSSAYGANDWTIYARTPGVSNNNAGTASTIEFRVEWNDDHVPQGAATVDGVDGTLTLSVDSVDPTDFPLQPPGTGDFTIIPPDPTLTTFSAITGN
jgi:hypothetical protein